MNAPPPDHDGNRVDDVRAGVSTDASSAPEAQLLVQSAPTPAALDADSAELIRALRSGRFDAPGAFADLAFTLRQAPHAGPARRACLARDAAHAAALLERRAPERVFSNPAAQPLPIAFVFPGPDDLTPGLGARLVAREPAFQAASARCEAVFQRQVGFALTDVLWPARPAGHKPDLRRLLGRGVEAGARTGPRAEFAQPAAFAFEYALAELWRAWGIQPVAFMGCRQGELVAACLAGVLRLDDALRLCIESARFQQTQPAHELAEPRGRAAQELARLANACALDEPRIPYLSTVTGAWARAADLRAPDYWARALGAPAGLDEALATLLREPRVLLEVGPGSSLAHAVQRLPADRASLTLATLERAFDARDEREHTLAALGRLWCAGHEPDWQAFHQGVRREVVAWRLPAAPARGPHLLLLSAPDEAELEAATHALAERLRRAPEVELAEPAARSHVSDQTHGYRRACVGQDVADALALLEGRDARRVSSARCGPSARRLAFLLPGLGGQYLGMARGLYTRERAFAQALDEAAAACQPLLGFDLRRELDDASTAADREPTIDLRRMLGRTPATRADARLQRTDVGHPLMFSVQYALARLWDAWGLRPQVLLGYSLGEYTAACLAGVLSLPDAARVVCERARLIQELPAGALLAVALPETALMPRLSHGLSLMAVNAPEQCVVSGPLADVEALEQALLEQDVACRRLQAMHAFHSRMMEPLRGRLVALFRTIELRAPRVPYLSNVSGDWITPELACDPAYWGRHLCQPVRFADALARLLAEPGTAFLELGPPVLSSLLLQQPGAATSAPMVLAALRHGYETRDDLLHALDVLGGLWVAGVPVDWDAFRTARAACS